MRQNASEGGDSSIAGGAYSASATPNLDLGNRGRGRKRRGRKGKGGTAEGKWWEGRLYPEAKFWLRPWRTERLAEIIRK